MFQQTEQFVLCSQISGFIIRQFVSSVAASPAQHRTAAAGSLCFMDIELCRALERGMKGPASIKQPLISIYDTLIITFDPLCRPAVIKCNFSPLLVFASNVKTLKKHFESKISSKITIDNI